MFSINSWKFIAFLHCSFRKRLILKDLLLLLVVLCVPFLQSSMTCFCSSWFCSCVSWLLFTSSFTRFDSISISSARELVSCTKHVIFGELLSWTEHVIFGEHTFLCLHKLDRCLYILLHASQIKFEGTMWDLLLASLAFKCLRVERCLVKSLFT